MFIHDVSLKPVAKMDEMAEECINGSFTLHLTFTEIKHKHRWAVAFLAAGCDTGKKLPVLF